MYPALICPIFSFIFLHLIASNNHTTSIVMWAHSRTHKTSTTFLGFALFPLWHEICSYWCGCMWFDPTQGSAFIFGRSVKIPPSLARFLSSLFGTGWLFEVFLLCCVIIKHVAGHKKVIIVQFRLLTRPDTEKSD